MAWLTGYDGWSFYVHQCVLRAAGGRSGLVRARAGRQRGQADAPIMAHDNIIGYPDHYVQSTERHPMDYLSAQSDRARLGQGLRIGVEMDNYWFTAAAFASLPKHLPNARFSDATALVNWQRAVKSPQEIDYMRNAARIVEHMHAADRREDRAGHAQMRSGGRDL